MDDQTRRFYSNAAGRTAAAAYVHAEPPGGLLESFQGCRRILDVGCGSGRDLGVLLKGGKDAYGVDSVPEMLRAAAEHLGGLGLSVQGRLFDGELPKLSRFADGDFDGVLCSAVLMHLPEEQLFDAVYSLRRILRPGGQLRVSVPSKRADVDPETRRDAGERLFVDLAPAKLQLLLERVGFSPAGSKVSRDTLGRAGIEWWTGEFVRLEDAVDRPLHLVERILNRDKKDATYKLALFRALAEIAQSQSHLAVFTPEFKVKVPLAAIAEKWILYYWPVFEGDVFIPQRTNEKLGRGQGVAIRKPLDALIKHFSGAGGLTGFYSDWKGGRLSGEANRLFGRALSQFGSTIYTMPARYAGGGHYDVFQYDGFDKSLVMDVELWRELCLMGSWIRDATVLRWAEQSEVFAKGEVKASLVIDRLLVVPDQGRNVCEVQKFFASLPSRRCVWSRSDLGEKPFDVDHAMPFSYWRNNDLWNLFPAAPEVNSRKSDKLPTYRQLHASHELIVDSWRAVSDAMGERFEREAQTLLGREPFRKASWENLLFARFVEAFELTANQRGADRWEWAGLRDEPDQADVAPMSASSVSFAGASSAVSSASDPTTEQGPNIIPFAEVGPGAFVTHLPFIGSLAAGEAFHGLTTGSLDDLSDADWVEVPTKVARKDRFVVSVAGDSMEPTLKRGEFAIFEYHRSPRKDDEVVIANIPEFGSDHVGVETVKRMSQDTSDWIFSSDNPAHSPFRVSKTLTSHPILGTFVARL